MASKLLCSIVVLALLMVLVSCEKNVQNSKYTINDLSMQPGLEIGQNISIDTKYFSNSELQRGDIVELKFNAEKDPTVKRIVALPGDELSIQDDGFHINGKKVTSKNIKYSALDRQLKGYSRVPGSLYIALGDNQENSLDSVDYGLVSFDQLMGKMVNERASPPRVNIGSIILAIFCAILFIVAYYHNKKIKMDKKIENEEEKYKDLPAKSVIEIIEEEGYPKKEAIKEYDIIEVKDYILKSRKGGYKDPQIKNALIKSRWKKRLITAAFKELKKAKK